MEGDMAGWRDMVGRRDAEGNTQEIKMPDALKRPETGRHAVSSEGNGELTKTIVKGALTAGLTAYNPFFSAMLSTFGKLKQHGTTTANPDANRVKPGDGGAAEVTEEHKQKIENEIEARGMHPDSYAAEQLRKENAEFARQTGQGARTVDNAETVTGIPGALDVSQLPASREQELQNHSIVLYGKRYAVQRLHGKQYLIPIEED